MNDSPFANISNNDDSDMESLAKRAAEIETSKKPEPDMDTIKTISKSLDFSSRQVSESTDNQKQKRRKRAKVAKTQFNNTVTLESLELFERIADAFPAVNKGILVERAIELLAKKEGVT